MRYLRNAAALFFILVAVLFLVAYTAPVAPKDIDNNLGDIVSAENKYSGQTIEIEKPAENQTIDSYEPAKGVFPSRLEIPSIGVNAKIEHVGLTAEGNMDMTDSIENVAWYNLGPRPGELGSAAIGGHYGYPGPAVFRDLPKLKKGDFVYVRGDGGETKKFIVKETRIYQANDIVREVFFLDDGRAHLNIITCNGDWIPSLKTYDKRLVVFTDMVD